MTAISQIRRLLRTGMWSSLLILVGSACTLSEPFFQAATVIQTVEVTRQIEVTRIVLLPVTVTPTLTPEFSPTPSATPTITLTPSKTPTSTPSPTPAPLKVKILEHAQCRYGPGAAYLYKYGILENTVMHAIGRQEILARSSSGAWEPATWVYVRAIGGNNPCWISASLLEVRGDLMSVPVYTDMLPFSTLYLPPASVEATRSGNKVTVFWSYVWMTEDDYRGYLVEAWVCHEGQQYFAPVGYTGTNNEDGMALEIPDETGCLQPSSGRVYTAEKHGYTRWRLISWPASAPASSTATPQP